MKFTCDKCSAQYMISDDKVGPSGVKVRCKKCGNVIVVRRTDAATRTTAPAPVTAQPGNGGPAADGAAAPAESQTGAGGGAPAAREKGLDAELGQAFDHAFGDTPPSAPKPGGSDLAATQMMGEEDTAKITAAPPAAAAPSATEWYVAIGQAQVGPLPVSEVKKKWEAGDVGPDSLVWRPGMGDWSALSSVAELATYLAPIPRPAPKTTRDGARPDGRNDPLPTPAPAPEPTWKPIGASALAALANEEIAVRKAPEPKPQAPRQAPGGARSLMDALPDSGGVDPTGAIPLSIKALEHTEEKKIEPRRTSVARGAQETRHRRGVVRAVMVGVVVVVLVVGAAAAGVLWYTNRKLGGSFSFGGLESTMPATVPGTAAPPAPPPASPPATAARSPPAAAQPAAPAPSATEAPKPPSVAEAAPPARPARGESKRSRRSEPPPKPEPRVASATPTPPPPPPAPAPKKRGDLLDFESNDSALDEALAPTPSGRSVYVPPARKGGSGEMPEKLSPGDINASVAGRIDSLRRCVSEQKARDPNATGVLKMRWVIGGDGSVRDVKCLTSEFAQGPFAQCIAGVVKGIRFPRSRTTGQEVTFPFNF